MFEFVFRDTQLASKYGVLLVRDLIEIAGCDDEGGISPWGVCIELPQLQFNALTD
jgi:hypothetical protein